MELYKTEVQNIVITDSGISMVASSEEVSAMTPRAPRVVQRQPGGGFRNFKDPTYLVRKSWLRIPIWTDRHCRAGFIRWIG